MLVIAFGTRPEWIKIKPVIEAIEGQIPYKILFTGQHTDLISNNMIGDHDVITIPSREHHDHSSRLDNITIDILDTIPMMFYGAKYVMVQGDTTSAFAVALAAFHRKIPVIHLEAGLRTYDNDHPYPEEFNRQAIGALASVHLCATKNGYDNLVREGKDESTIHIIGNTVLDNLSGIETAETNQVLITMHRRENQKKLARWFIEFSDLASEYPDLKFILPIHPNPDILKFKDTLEGVEVVDALEHGKLIKILKNCKMVITDSGGIQEESAFFRKPCIVCREKTERTEGINEFSWLCGDPKKLAETFKKLQDVQIDSSLECPYGDGQSSKKILKLLKGMI